MRREDEVARIRERLLRFGFPRARMLLLVLLTGGCGLLASWLMLRAGLVSMPLRYLLALGIAYAIFLLLVRLFVEHVDPTVDIPGDPTRPCSTGSGGGRIDAGPSSAHDAGLLDGLGGADEALPLVLLAIAALAIACALLWVVVSAPTLFAELLVDGALSATLYRRLRKLDQRHWLDTALRHTIGPFLVTAIVLVAFAFAAQHYRPLAHSIGDVFAQRNDAWTR
ncbi:hypothetical protein [Dokdonella sp.]|uniref:hypothetical protein n=1 Tax=Dokdonella sp. TaxID=2291710 RepID=UPI002F3E1FC4